MVSEITQIGEIGVFILNIIILYLLIKRNKEIENYNKTRPPQLKQTPIKKNGLALYLGVWIIASIFSWYFLEFIKLGEFFTLSVIAPCAIVLILEWCQLIR